MNQQLPIVDCHMQFWDDSDPNDAIRPWLRAIDPNFTEAVGDYSTLQKQYLIADYKKDIGPFQVVKTVTIDSGTTDPLREIQWLARLAEKTGFPSGVTGHVDLLSPDLDALLERYANIPIVRSVRQHVNYDTTNPKRRMAERSDLLMDTQWRKQFQRIQRYGYNWELAIFSNQLTQAIDFATAFPNTQIVLGAMGWPLDFSASGMESWRKGMQQLAKSSNVVVKLAAIGCVFKKWQEAQIRPWIRTTIDLFGVDRCMFGSAMPVDKIHRGFVDIYSAYKNIVADFSYAEQKQLFHDNALRVYRL